MLVEWFEWFEGELSAGHRMSWPMLEDHGWPLALALGLAVGAAMLLEASRLLGLLRAVLHDD